MSELEKKIFSCRQCGHCCHGETTVSLDANDLKRLIDFLGLPEEEVRKRYLRVTGNVVQMKVVNGHCIFYNQGCTVHPGKPWRCGQWPLHPSILTDPNNLESIRQSCPGMNKDMSYEEFCAILRELQPRQG